MQFDITGVVFDGSSPSVDFQPDTRAAVRIVQGASIVVRVFVRTPSGEQFDLAHVSASAQLVVNKNPSDYAHELLVSGVISPLLGRGAVVFTLTPAQTKQLQPGLHCYSVIVTAGSDRHAVVPGSPLVVQPGVLLP